MKIQTTLAVAGMFWVCITHAQDASVSVRWEPVPGVTGYRVYAYKEIENQPDVYSLEKDLTQDVPASKGTTCTLSGFDRDKWYKLGVTSFIVHEDGNEEESAISRGIFYRASNNDAATRECLIGYLQLGMQGEDVEVLQRVLNTSLDTIVAITGPGSPGKESTDFDILTKAAVMRFQQKHNIQPANGIVGEMTLRALNLYIEKK